MIGCAAFAAFFVVAFVVAGLAVPAPLAIGAGLAAVLVVAARRPGRRR